jgi:hypothetical protein
MGEGSAEGVNSDMTTKVILLSLPLCLLGCSRDPVETQNSRVPTESTGPHAQLPFTISVVEAPETKEIKEIKREASLLLARKDYDKLDAFAKRLRDSKESYADGVWKVFYVYDGLDLSDEASDAEWQKRFKAIKSWIDAKPDSITARVAMAKDLVSYAWKARGTGYADTVSEASWKVFYQRLNQAVNVLNSAKTLNEQCPCLWSVLLQAHLGSQIERSQYDATFEAAIKAWPDYTPYYFKRAYFLFPRWYGAEGEWEKDLEQSADKVGGDEGDMLYARVVWSAHQTGTSTDIFEDYKLSWPRVDKGFEIIEKRFPNSLIAQNEAAHLAGLAHDGNATRKYLERTRGKVDVSVWDSLQQFVDYANNAYTPVGK